MGDVTGIEWTDHTFNPWWGCTRISPACEHCYAETFAARFGVSWGVKAERRPASEKVWRTPLKWNAQAEKEGRRHRVFCASMADVFEERRELDSPRERLFALIEATPWLDWQLLTKRPELTMAMVPQYWRAAFPANVWIGTTVEDQRRADIRIPHLLRIPARVRFLSCEPLLGPVDLAPWIGGHVLETFEGRWLRNTHPDAASTGGTWLAGIEWVIAGGESGPGARPMHPGWPLALRDVCAKSGVPFFFKQWGEWAPTKVVPGGDLGGDLRSGFTRHVRDRGESDGHFRSGDVYMGRVGKKAAGSLLGGVEHKAFPMLREALAGPKAGT